MDSGECKATLEGHNNGVSGVAVSRDGRTLASGSCDCTIKYVRMLRLKSSCQHKGQSGRNRSTFVLTQCGPEVPCSQQV